jgi:Tol biopolymer transport system component
MSADGKGQTEISSDYWGYTSHDIGAIFPVWSPDSRFLAFINDAEVSEGDAFLATATRSGTSYRRLKAGVFSPPAWQRQPRSRS